MCYKNQLLHVTGIIPFHREDIAKRDFLRKHLVRKASMTVSTSLKRIKKKKQTEMNLFSQFLT